jgi:PHP family Zn ribbon phosphoesterase
MATTKKKKKDMVFMRKRNCVKCGSKVKKGYCTDETCPFSDATQDKPIHIPGFDPPIPNMKDPKTAAKVRAFLKKKMADGKSKSYLVTWTIDIEADSADEAAAQAFRIQQDPETEADHFKVKDKATGKISHVNAKSVW